MSKADKLMKKLMDPAQIHNVTFEEAVLLLTRAGFVNDLGKGSHQVYRHTDGRRVTLPKHGSTLKPIYIRTIRELLS